MFRLVPEHLESKSNLEIRFIQSVEVKFLPFCKTLNLIVFVVLVGLNSLVCHSLIFCPILVPALPLQHAVSWNFTSFVRVQFQFFKIAYNAVQRLLHWSNLSYHGQFHIYCHAPWLFDLTTL